MTSAREWVERIHQLELPRRYKVMNVCGGHERSVTLSGMRSALPDKVEIIPGPGCPVCVCPEQDIYQAMQLALQEKVTLVTFGDMLRVPVNAPKSEPRSLVEARAAGADVRPIASPIEARMIAEDTDGPVVLFAAGFETTTAPVASLFLEGAPDNLSLLLSGRLTWPAVAMLLESDDPGFDALIAPGHVAAVMGPEEWEFVPEKYGIPAAIGAFTADSLLAATWSVLRQALENKPFLDNCYQSLVRPGGNPVAHQHLEQVLQVEDAEWRGIGSIPQSGFALREAFAAHDARRLFPDFNQQARRRMGEMPPGCDCARVVLGKIYPDQCRLFGNGCNPRNPVGPCMVSDEGACRIWWSGGMQAA
jgi:hydrogenase expression/formation protein HypD